MALKVPHLESKMQFAVPCSGSVRAGAEQETIESTCSRTAIATHSDSAFSLGERERESLASTAFEELLPSWFLLGAPPRTRVLRSGSRARSRHDSYSNETQLDSICCQLAVTELVHGQLCRYGL